MSDGQSDIDYGTTDDEEPPQEDTAGDGPRRVETPSDPNPRKSLENNQGRQD